MGGNNPPAFTMADAVKGASPRMLRSTCGVTVLNASTFVLQTEAAGSAGGPFYSDGLITNARDGAGANPRCEMAMATLGRYRFW
jgi:hypothetical protein